MKKTPLGLSLLALSTLLAGCGNKTNSPANSTSTSKPSTSTTTNSSHSGTSTSHPSTSNTGSSTSTTTSKEPSPTASLTDDMLSGLKEGYAASFNAVKQYADGTKPSIQHYETQSISDKFNYASYNVKDDGSLKKYGKTKYYRAVKDGNKVLTKEFSLSLDNTLFATTVTEEDSITQKEIDLEWQYSYFGNVLADFSASDFTKKDSNTFVLSSDKTSSSSDALKTQFFSPTSLYLPGSDCNYFALKTDGDKVIGFELTCETYVAIDVAASFNTTGTFTASGKEAYKDVAPLTGETDSEFDAIMNKLKLYNWNLTQTQSQYDVTGEAMTALGTMKITVADNGTKEYWEYYNTSNKRIQGYGYMDYQDPDDPDTKGKLGVVKINDTFYEDAYLYQGSMKDKMPSFNLDSRFFKKDTTASVNGKKVYKLSSPVEISDENLATLFITPENMRSYDDRLINLTVTEDGDTITLRNTTSTNDDESSGLIMNCEYTNIGKVTGFMDESNVRTSVAGLKWSDLISNNEVTCTNILSAFGKENIDSLPLIDDNHANIYVDVSNGNNKPIFYIYTYDDAETESMKSEYGAKLVSAGLEEDTSVTKADTDTSLYYVKHNVTINGEKGRTYTGDLAVEISTFYNTIQDWGQFQISLSTKNLLPKQEVYTR